MMEHFIQKYKLDFVKYTYIHKQFTKKKDSLCKASKKIEKYDIFLVV